MLYLKKQKGFTIVETMIVLGITGVLFVSVSLLISGQTERYRYRDSMYRLQQQVQDQINDVQTGQFYTDIATTDGKSDNELVGKKILFCIDNVAPFCSDKSTKTSFNVDIVQKDDATYGAYKSWVENLPGGIEYVGSKKVNASNEGELHDQAFGIDVKYGTSTTSSGALGVDLYTYINYTGSSNYLLSSFNDGRAFLLCFEGYKRGSLELGSKELGNTVKLNLVDSRCD